MEDFRANQATLHVVCCVLAIVVGVLMLVNVFHVGDAHKAAGIVEITVGTLFLV